MRLKNLPKQPPKNPYRGGRIGAGWAPENDEETMARRRVDNLTHKEFHFCLNYIKTGDVKASALKAGYSPSVSNDATYLILRRPNVKAFIDGKIREATEAAGATITWRVSKLKHGADLALPDNARSHEDCDIGSARACIAELNKMDGSYAAEKSEVNQTMGIEIKEVEELTKEYEREY